eukprot:Partr_v1_DN26492_c0_g1_i13_m23776 putative cysteine peptidase
MDDGNWWLDFSNRMLLLRNSISQNVASFLYDSSAAAGAAGGVGGGRVWILGVRYDDTRNVLFWSHFRSLLWMTYRTSFPPLLNASSSDDSRWTSDVGWGCMIRSGQSLLAQGLIAHMLGRGWRLGSSLERSEYESYQQTVKWFIDSASADCFFSIHEITRLGSERYSIDIGQWYGPNAIAQVLAALVNQHSIANSLGATVVAHVAVGIDLDLCIIHETSCSDYSRWYVLS